MGIVIRSKAEDAQAIDLARRILRKAPHLKCGACGQQDFATIEQPQANARTMLWRHMVGGQIEDTVRSQTTVSLICTNCGHIEQFVEAIVDGQNPEQYGEPVKP